MLTDFLSKCDQIYRLVPFNMPPLKVRYSYSLLVFSALFSHSWSLPCHSQNVTVADATVLLEPKHSAHHVLTDNTERWFPPDGTTSSNAFFILQFECSQLFSSVLLRNTPNLNRATHEFTVYSGESLDGPWLKSVSGSFEICFDYL